ncbi:hypothetical protein NDU88_003640 [Pleurodeles waltl]|uniref:Uncharacterized protein n=1 Tax=Pleurodeles waltl TaxID=8319 RepID=A0AAV7QCB2_PLEWA|nr:hypothetical protein NDU88_003640 [Pleurodeles waltl]
MPCAAVKFIFVTEGSLPAVEVADCELGRAVAARAPFCGVPHWKPPTNLEMSCYGFESLLWVRGSTNLLSDPGDTMDTPTQKPVTGCQALKSSKPCPVSKPRSFEGAFISSLTVSAGLV